MPITRLHANAQHILPPGVEKPIQSHIPLLTSLLPLSAHTLTLLLEGWSKTTSNAVVVRLVLGIAVRACSRGAGSRAGPGASHSTCTIPANDTVGVADVALVLLVLVLHLHLADYTTQKIMLVGELVLLGLDVGESDLQRGFLGLESGLVGVQVLDGGEEDGLLAVALLDHVAEPGVVDGLAAAGGVDGRGGGCGSDQWKFETWRRSSGAGNAGKGRGWHAGKGRGGLVGRKGEILHGAIQRAACFGRFTGHDLTWWLGVPTSLAEQSVSNFREFKGRTSDLHRDGRTDTLPRCGGSYPFLSTRSRSGA